VSKSYSVKFIKDEVLEITGKGNHSLWENANLLIDFISPWETEKPTRTEFKALYNATSLFFSFKVYDLNIHINKKDDSNVSIGNSDRVELFFRTDKNLSPYYCLEMDSTSRIMDFKAYPNKKFNFDWNWPKNDINLKSNITKTGYTVEGTISLASLNKLNLINDNKIETGIYRAKYSKKNNNFEPTWISWVNPNTKTPNFHIASSFGLLHLLDKNKE